jgi:pyruvate formate-lyase activating enzyme-like uncharacterized protein
MSSQPLAYAGDFTGLPPQEQDVTPSNSDHEDPDYEPQGDLATPKRKGSSVVYSTPSQRSNRSAGVSHKTKDELEALHVVLYGNTGLPKEKHCLVTKRLNSTTLDVCHVIRKAEKFETVRSNILKWGG